MEAEVSEVGVLVTTAGGGRASVSGGGGSTGHANEAEALLLLELFKLNKSNELWDFCGPGPRGSGNTFGQKMGGGEAGGWCGDPAVLSWAGLASCNNGLAPTTTVLSSYPATVVQQTSPYLGADYRRPPCRSLQSSRSCRRRC